MLAAAAWSSGAAGFALHARTMRARATRGVLRRQTTHGLDDASHLGECGAARYTLRERNPYDVHVYYSDEASKADTETLRARVSESGVGAGWVTFDSNSMVPALARGGLEHKLLGYTTPHIG